MDNQGKALRDAWLNLVDTRYNLQESQNAKLFFLVSRDSNRLFDLSMAEFKDPHVLTTQLEACCHLLNLYTVISPFLFDRDHLLGEGEAKGWHAEYGQFRANIADIIDLLPEIQRRSNILGELLRGNLVGDEPMGLDAISSFIESLKPEVGDPNPISFHSTPIEGPNPYYVPANPMKKVDKFKGEEILWDPDESEDTGQKEAEESQYEGHDESELAERDDMDEVRGTD